jgi:TrmH family RNA methyltransferase
MITSPQNEKLKLVRKLHDRKYRKREQSFFTEGEDLLEAGLAAGAQPRFVLVQAGAEPPLAEMPLVSEEVDPPLLAEVSNLGSSTRVLAVWPQRWVRSAGSFCLYLHGVSDPGNVGTIIRTAHALVGGVVVLGPGCADPYSPKAVRASMGSIFPRPPMKAYITATPEPRLALLAHGGKPMAGPAGEEGIPMLREAATICLGAEREGLGLDVLLQCDSQVTIPLRKGSVESLNVAAVAAIVCERVASAAPGGGPSQGSEGEP